MTFTDFQTAVAENKDLCLADIIEKDDKAWLIIEIRDKKDGQMISLKSVLDNSWDALEPVLLGLRAPTVMIHMTRIVGYYSRLASWNPSKLAELDDRHKGQYSAPESSD